ncbi:cytochrome P450 [Actinokineospora spheciospongiae]|uniref:cytochrome P450 n=1 Tax=Actinokineospora spheciospongiae TaxID=909613 RepID=UPI0011B7D339|nr:cytochrome P450 [Actinokineospora spheciospongiae]
MTSAEELPRMTEMFSPLFGRNDYLRELQAGRPIWKVRTPAGDEAWLVVQHAEIRALLVDRKLVRSHPDPDNAAQYVQSPIFDMVRSEPIDHASFRAALTPFFSRSSMRRMEPVVVSIVDELVEAMAARTPPVELQQQFSVPMGMRVLCAFVGVPDEDWAALHGMLYEMATIDAEGDHAARYTTKVGQYLRELLVRKRAEPGEDVLSGLIGAGLSDDEVARLGTMLIFAGGDSVSNSVGYGLGRLAANPHLRDALIEDTDLVPAAVEELLRTATYGGGAHPHYAAEDIEIAGVTIRAGDLVLPDFALANFDERAFDNPDEIDFTRESNPHLAFAHGVWHCLGAPLARMELAIAVRALLARFPTLRLPDVAERAGGKDQARLSSTMDRLVITW